MAVEQYPWSDSGRQLLKELQIRIDIYGGREKLARDIEAENKRHVTNHWQPYEISVLLQNRFDFPKVERITGRSNHACESKLKQIKEKVKLRHQIFN